MFSSAAVSGTPSFTREQLDVLTEVWHHNKLKIAKPCAPRAGLLISGLPQIQAIPDLENLRALSVNKPFDAVIQLVDSFVVVQGLWEKFLEIMSDVGLELVREEFFDQALRGNVCCFCCCVGEIQLRR